MVGVFDQITSAGRNIYDGDFTRSSEREWYARTRFRPDFTFEVGRTKAVLGLEIDLQYGQAGANDGGFPGNVSGTTSGCKAGTNGCMDTNTDVGGMIEIKWLYTEFDLTGKNSLLPFIPVQTVARLGGQPFATLANYRFIYATGDFAGISAVTTWAQNLKTNVAFVMVEDEIAGSNRLARTSGNRRGNDFALILSPEITPLSGLDIKPLYSYFYVDGAIATGRRTVANQQGVVAPTHERRHTIGLDGRWRSGPFSLDPTVMFQFGTTQQKAAVGAPGGNHEAEIRAWLVDIQGGWQLGPLLLEARGVWTTGNKAKDDLRSTRIEYFQPLDVDTGYWVGWSQIQALGVDYFNGGGAAMAGMPSGIGYDRYGRRGFALRATYSVTPTLALYGIVSPTWTDERVDTDTTSGAAGRGAPNPLTNGGDSRYIGTEADLGLTWRFAPNTVFDLVGAWLFAGSALDTRQPEAPGAFLKREAVDGWTVAARMRLSF